MANRVNVNINVNDLSRGGLRSVRNSIRNQMRTLPDDHRITVTLNDDATRAGVRRVNRAIRSIDDRVTVRVNMREPTRGDQNRVRSAIRNAVREPVRGLGGFVSGVLQDGVGQGLVNGFKAGGPVAAAVLATVLISALSIVGASLSGLIVTALGAAFVGVGGISAAMSEEVKSKWTSTLEVLKKRFEEVGKPMIPVLTSALDKLEQMANQAAPKLVEALEKTTPATEKFIDMLMEGFRSFGKEAFDPIMEAWNVFAPVFGEQWNEFMRELGAAFGDMADLVREHPTEIAMALEIVFETLELLVRTVTFFGEVWAGQMQFAFSAAGLLAQGIEQIGTMFLDMTGTIIDGLASAFGWIPGLGPKLEDAAEAFGAFKERAKARLEEIGNAGRNMGSALDRANKVRKLEADISSYEHKLAKARADLKKTSDQKARAKLTADIRDLEAKARRARQELAAIKNRSVSVTVTYYKRGDGASFLGASGRYAQGGAVGSKAPKTGFGRAASGGVRANMTLVGEQGPEFVDLPVGSRVRPNSNSRQIARAESRKINNPGMGGTLGNAPGGGFGAHGGMPSLMIDAAGDDVSQFLLKILRKAIRVEGGNVQIVLGKG